MDGFSSSVNDGILPNIPKLAIPTSMIRARKPPIKIRQKMRTAFFIQNLWLLFMVRLSEDMNSFFDKRRIESMKNRCSDGNGIFNFLSNKGLFNYPADLYAETQNFPGKY
jgi:hypothetical protein